MPFNSLYGIFCFETLMQKMEELWAEERSLSIPFMGFFVLKPQKVKGHSSWYEFSLFQFPLWDFLF